MYEYRDLIIELCVGRFARLVKYFEHLDDNELKIIEPDDMIIYTEPCDRLIMKVFLEKIYNSIYADIDKYNRHKDIIIKPCMTIIKEFNLVYCNIRNKLKSCFSNASGIYSNDKFTIVDGNEFILNTIKECSISADMMILLDLSENKFIDCDTRDIKLLIDELSLMYSENSIIVRLRCNSLYFCDEFIKCLLLMKNIKYIDLCHCPISSLDRSDFLNSNDESLQELIIDKLVYIPNIYIHCKPWRNLIKKTETLLMVDKRIIMTHNLYYSITSQMALDDY